METPTAIQVRFPYSREAVDLRRTDLPDAKWEGGAWVFPSRESAERALRKMEKLHGWSSERTCRQGRAYAKGAAVWIAAIKEALA